MKIAIDCANGRWLQIWTKSSKSLGAKVYKFGVSPNGFNINDNCGSTFPNKIKFLVKKYKANLGIALDGDADRIIISDEKGNIIDGDQIIAMLATRWKRKNFKGWSDWNFDVKLWFTKFFFGSKNKVYKSECWR